MGLFGGTGGGMGLDEPKLYFLGAIRDPLFSLVCGGFVCNTEFEIDETTVTGLFGVTTGGCTTDTGLAIPVVGCGTGEEETVAVGLTTAAVFFPIVLFVLLTIDAWNIATEWASANCFRKDSTSLLRAFN